MIVAEAKGTHNFVGASTLTEKTLLRLKNSEFKPQQRNLKYGLNTEQVKEFWDTGFIILKNVFDDESIQQWDNASHRVQKLDGILDPNNVRTDIVTDSITNENSVWKFDPFHDLDLTFNSLVSDRRILDKLASLYEGREPFLFKDKFICKPPGSHGSGLHQDYTWWQGFPTSLISVMVSLDPATKENGCTTLFPGFKEGLMIPKGDFGHIDPKKVDLNKATCLESQPGDIAIFHCMTPHLANKNNSKLARRQFFITYNDSKDGEHYQAHRQHYHWYMTRNQNNQNDTNKYFI